MNKPSINHRQFVRNYLKLKHGINTKVSFSKYGIFYKPEGGDERCLVRGSHSEDVKVMIHNAADWLVNK